jgi:polar amino acid transport system substrate-binding protein
MRAVIVWILFTFVAGPALADDAAARRELVPTGKLRVGIGVGQAASAFWTTRDEAGRPRGVTVTLGHALAQKLGVPLELVAYNSSSEVVDAGAGGQWDVSFIPFDAERAKKVDFGPNYYLFTSTYLVSANAPIRTIEEVDRAGIRVAGVANTTTIRTAERTLKAAQIVPAGSMSEVVGLLRDGKVDAIAFGREALEGLLPTLPGARLLDGHFHATGAAVAVPKGKPAALAYVTAFIEEAKASGVVRKALDENGIKGPVAPAAK